MAIERAAILAFDLAQRYKQPASFIASTFDKISKRVGANVGNLLHDIGQARGEDVKMAMFRARWPAFYVGGGGKEEPFVMSASPRLKVDPKMIPTPTGIGLFDYGNVILSPVGVNQRSGEMCDSGGCVPRSVWNIMEGGESYSQIKKDLNFINMVRGRKPSNFKSTSIGGRYETGADAISAAARLEGDLLWTGQGNFVPVDKTAELVSHVIERVPNFGLGTLQTNGVGHMHSYVRGAPAAEHELAIPDFILNNESMSSRKKGDPEESLKYILVPKEYREATSDILSKLQSVGHPGFHEVLIRETDRARLGK